MDLGTPVYIKTQAELGLKNHEFIHKLLFDQIFFIFCSSSIKFLMIKLADYLNVNLVIHLDAETRDEALSDMVNLIAAAGKLKNKNEFFKAIMDREAIISTGIGMGVAIPHAKLPTYDNFFIAIGLLQKGVNWEALDDAKVRIIFMIGGPDDKQTEYLQILSRLTLVIKEEERRKKMLSMKSPSAIIGLFETF